MSKGPFPTGRLDTLERRLDALHDKVDAIRAYLEAIEKHVADKLMPSPSISTYESQFDRWPGVSR